MPWVLLRPAFLSRLSCSQRDISIAVDMVAGNRCVMRLLERRELKGRERKGREGTGAGEARSSCRVFCELHLHNIENPAPHSPHGFHLERAGPVLTSQRGAGVRDRSTLGPVIARSVL